MLVTFSRPVRMVRKSVAAPNDRLVGVVGIQVQAAATEDLCEDVTRSGDTLTSSTTDTNGKGLFHG